MILLGKIVRLQVQTASLKTGSGIYQKYDNSALAKVDELELDDGGVWGIQDGERLADVHHRDHPETKLRGTLNSISFGFVGHYDTMRERFGPHLIDGAAGENFLIKQTGIVSLDEVSHGVFVDSQVGGSFELRDVAVAEPCAPFSRWALQFPAGAKPDRTVTEALQFLSNGMRGYYCNFDGPPRRISLGDSILIAV